MIAVKDRDAENQLLPLADFLLAVLQHANLQQDKLIEITRFGGVGDRVWAIESKLDQGDRILTTIGELISIVSDTSQTIDELRCVGEGIVFGIFDSTFLFCQAVNKSLEEKIAFDFQDAMILPDRDFS